MKKKLSLLLLILMLPQIVFAARPENLRDLIDDYSYAMTVEWDQKDMAFAHTKRAEFVTALSTFAQNGLTKEEIVAATGVDLVSIKNEVDRLNLRNADEVANFLINRREFQKGASWVGDVVLATVFFTPFIIMIALMIDGALHRGERLNNINACIAANPENNDFCFDRI